jgi:hypothetical protein
MQAFAAKQLLNVQASEDVVQAFDARVLRTRDQSRRAKEFIKARALRAGPTVATEVLLDIARGRTPRDADWAMQALAQRALAGEVIEGLSVEGVAGI